MFSLFWFRWRRLHRCLATARDIIPAYVLTANLLASPTSTRIRTGVLSGSTSAITGVLRLCSSAPTKVESRPTVPLLKYFPILK